MNLNKTYLYKRKFNFNLVLGFVYLILPALGETPSLYSSQTYYTILVIVQSLILCHVFGKRVVINDQEIANLIFWKLPLWSVVWPELEEVSVIPVLNNKKTGSQAAMEPFATIRWLTGVSARGFRVKMIVTQSEAVYLNLSAIKDGEAIYEVLKSKAHVFRS